MKKSMLALLLTCALLFGLLPTAQADSLGLYFGARQVNYKPENLIVWAETASAVLDEYYGEA